MLGCRPNPISSILNGLTFGSTSCSAACVALLRLLIVSPDTRPRIMRFLLKDWDFKYLVDCIRLCMDMPMMGGRNAAADAVAVMSNLCQPPAQPSAGGTASDQVHMEACHRKLIDANAIEALVEVCKQRYYLPMAKSASLECLNALMRRGPADAKVRFLNCNAIVHVTNLLGNERIDFVGKAAGAGALRWVTLPHRTVEENAAADEVLRDKLSEGDGAAEGGTPAKADNFAMAPSGAMLPGESAGDAPPAWAVGDETAEAIILEEALLDEEMKQRVLQRVEIVARAGAIRPLVRLCEGAEGALPEIDPNNPPPPDVKGKKGKKKGGKKGKKKKLEPGQAEAQTNAAGCLRLLSLSDNNKVSIIKEQGVRYLTPLLTTKADHARWHARQVLLNCAMLPNYTKLMQMYKVPDYVTAANVPEDHFYPRLGDRPTVRPMTTGDVDDSAPTQPPPMSARGPPRGVKTAPSNSSRDGQNAALVAAMQETPNEAEVQMVHG
uniref:Uncharacterized protein n=1 Tax=Tetraselmis chuii TaxID=63592 RepID=A0A7S1SVA0_9CHLO